MRAADHIVDLGPGAGENGGTHRLRRHVREADRGRQRLADRAVSAGELHVSAPRARGAPSTRNACCRFSGARVHNLKNIDVEIPLGMMVAITGVSGSGKSTLVHDVIYQLARSAAQGRANRSCRGETPDRSAETRLAALTCRRVEGAERIRRTVMVDQSPIGRTPRSNPVTYIKAFDLIRDAVRRHARGRAARLHGRTFFVQHPRRPLRDLPGRRHRHGGDAVSGRRGADLRGMQRHALQERHSGDQLQGLNIHEVLQLTVREAMAFFHDTPRLVQS